MKNLQCILKRNLSGREMDVLKLLCEGLTHRKIAEKLLISKRTADVHVSNIMIKLGIHNKAGLVVYAIRHKIVEI